MDAENRSSQAPGLQPSDVDAVEAPAGDQPDHTSPSSASDFVAANPVTKANIQPAIIRAETNCLRFPIFAIGTKGLREIDGYEAVGSSSEGGQSTDYLYKVTKNTDDVCYPGDLARRIHNALLAKLELQGFPYQDSVTFTWRELARLIGISWKGSKKAEFITALKAIHGLRIWSNLALKQKSSYCDIATREEHTVVEPLAERQHGFNLYSEVVFQGQTLADGSVADINRVVFSGWLIANLNSFYSAKIDRQLWLELDRVGPLASRLYEYLLFSRSGHWNSYKIRYERLCTFLPARVMDCESKARNQFKRALDALKLHKVIKRVDWKKNATGELLLDFRYGDSVRTMKTPSSAVQEIDDGLEVRVLRSGRTPAAELVSAFYGAWTKDPHHRPWQKELDYAREVIDDFGLEDALQLVPHLVRVLKDEFPTCKTFNGTGPHWDKADKLHQRSIAAQRSKQRAARQKAKEERQRAKKQQQYERDRDAFLQLPQEEQQRYEELYQASVTPQEYARIRKFESLKLSFVVGKYVEENGSQG